MKPPRRRHPAKALAATAPPRRVLVAPDKFKGTLTAVQAAKAIAEATFAADAAFPVEFASSLPEAVRRAYLLAAPSGIVLLSPACASFDMFRNMEHRGEVFRAAVRGLSGEV